MMVANVDLITISLEELKEKFSELATELAKVRESEERLGKAHLELNNEAQKLRTHVKELEDVWALFRRR